MDQDFYGRKNNEENKRDTTYSYSYVNPAPGQENPNETMGYQNTTQQGYQYQENQERAYHTAGNAYSYQEEARPRKQSSGFGKTMAKVVAAALVFGLVSSGVFVGVTKATGVSLGGASSVVSYKSNKVSSNSAQLMNATDVSGIVDAAMPSIVAITNTAESEVQSFFGSQKQTVQSAGSGIIIGEDSDRIYLVTNNHVVDGSIDLKVTFSDNETVEAAVKGTDAGSDLAVVSVKKKDLKSSTKKTIKVAVMGDSDKAKVGESVIAIGNALGYGQSVTTGVVSAKERSVTVENISNSLLQTDAAINPGNSGGALLNSKGEVIGINSAKYSDTEVEGIGYAIPMSKASPIIESIITREAVDDNEKGYLGIYGTDITSDFSSVYNIPMGVYINQLVEGGAAAKAGLLEGDIITKIEGFEVKTMSELQHQLQYYKAGTKVTIKAQVKDGGEYVEKTYKVTLQKNAQ